jgi:hypothetical protein
MAFSISGTKKGGVRMAVFRIEKTQNHTVMNNHHLRNKNLSLKAKGLLSQMLSLPEEWDYTLSGLSSINRESIDAVRTGIWELERAGYIKRKQRRDTKGKMATIEYTIYEQPRSEPEYREPPLLDFPTSGNPTSENPMQLNKERIKGLKEKSVAPTCSQSIDHHAASHNPMQAD